MATPTEVSKDDISFNFLMKKFSFAEQEMKLSLSLIWQEIKKTKKLTL